MAQDGKYELFEKVKSISQSATKAVADMASDIAESTRDMATSTVDKVNAAIEEKKAAAEKERKKQMNRNVLREFLNPHFETVIAQRTQFMLPSPECNVESIAELVTEDSKSECGEV